MAKPDPSSAINRVQWLLNWADELVRSRSWNEADAVFRSAIKLDETPQSTIAYGCALAEQERFNEAICQLTRAIDLAQTMTDRTPLATIYHNLASIYREVGDHDSARRFQQRAVSLTDSCGSDELIGLANDAWLARRVDLAECLAGTAADIEEDDLGLGSQINSEPGIEATVGMFAGLLRDPREGIRPLLKAYKRHRALGELRLMGIDLMNLSVLFGQIGRHRGELAFLRRAIACFDAAPAPISSAKARRLLTHLERLRRLRQFDPSLN